MAKIATPRSQIVGQRAHWLLDLDVGGRVYRISDAALEVVDANGNSLVYTSGLGRIGFTKGEVGQSVAISVSIGVDWALEVSRGTDLQLGRGELRRWFEGQTFEEAAVLMVGDVVAPDHGGPDEPLTFSLERQPWRDTTKIIAPDAVVSETTWPSSATFRTDDAILGQPYPIIIGAPGYLGYAHDGSAAPITPGSPALLVDHTLSAAFYRSSKLLIAGHEVRDTSVRVYDMSGGRTGRPVSEQLPVTHTTDLLGRKVAYIDITTATEVSLRPGNEYWIAWGDPAVDGGGLYDSTRSGVLRGAGDVIAYLLERGTASVDRGRMLAAAAFLNAYKIDCYILEAVSAWEWIERHLAPLLPIVYRESSSGAWYGVRRWDATAKDAVAHIDLDEGGYRRRGPVRVTPRSDVVNEVTVEYACTQGKDLIRRVTVTGNPDTDDPTQVSSYIAAWSQTRYGRRQARERVKAFTVLEDATAALIAHSIILEHAIPRRTLDLDAPPEVEALEPDAVVTVSSEELYLDEAVALIDTITPTQAGAMMSLILLDHPLQRNRSTS